jgi:uncharacterized protein (TIGR03435 family)
MNMTKKFVLCERFFRKKRVCTAIGAAILLACLALRIGAAPQGAQSIRGEWEKAAGGKMSFEVASVKHSTVEGYHSNFPLTLGSNFGAVGNLFSAAVPLRALIGFAFKLSVGQTQFLIPGLPDWVNSQIFDVEARAPIPTPTKDQFRLMVQSLLADRFKLTLHDEMRQIPFYALVLAKQGKTGPQLRPHVDDAKCGAEGRPDAPPAVPEFLPFPCGSILIGPAGPLLGQSGGAAGQVAGGGRNVDLNYIAAFLNGTGFQGTAPDRPIVNRTGLTGAYDFWIEFVPDANALGDAAQPAATGPSFPEALRDQLGLKLTATTGPIDTFAVDHIEEPSAD